MAQYQVNSTAELLTALKSATGDTTILLKSGNYGQVNLDGSVIDAVRMASNVTLKSLDPNNPATITGLDVKHADNLTLDGLNFDFTATFGSAGLPSNL